jgi:hypothetical protein
MDGEVRAVLWLGDHLPTRLTQRSGVIVRPCAVGCLPACSRSGWSTASLCADTARGLLQTKVTSAWRGLVNYMLLTAYCLSAHYLSGCDSVLLTAYYVMTD